MSVEKPASNHPDGRVTLISFGFKYGLPEHCAMVFDVRMLRNPFWVPELRHLNGTDQSIRDYVFEDTHTLPLCDKITDLLESTVPLYRPLPDRNTVIGIGCTGGRHRSVAVVRELADRLKCAGWDLDVIHRDIDKDTAEANGEEP